MERVNNLNDVLDSVGINVDTTEPEIPHILLSDDDFLEILSDNGFNIEPEQQSTTITTEDDINDDAVTEDEPDMHVRTVTDPDGRTLDLRLLADAVDQMEERLEAAVHNVRTAAAQDNHSTSTPQPHEQSHEAPLIPTNSPTLVMNDTTTRFSGTEWFNEIQRARIILAGIGGIGSNVAFQLARMCPETIIMYDDDRVETVNMAGQLFSTSDIGAYKVNAMLSMMTNYTSMRNIYALTSRFTSDCEAGDIMICGFDNMTARKTFFIAWNKHVMEKPLEEREKCLFLDGRLSIDTLQVLCIRGDDDYNMARYVEEFLFTDAEADETVCSMKQTTYLACMIGSIMVNLFTNFVAGTLDPVIPYDLPFFTEYNAQQMMFKTEN